MSIITDKDGSYFVNNDVTHEKESRRRILRDARMLGCEKEASMIFDKYDKLLRNCTNDKERQDIGKMGVYEIFCLFGRGGELYVNGQLVYKE